MTNKVVPIFKYKPRAMGQCPQCMGFQVLFNCPPPVTAGPAAHAEWEESVKENRDAGWHCLSCKYYW